MKKTTLILLAFAISITAFSQNQKAEKKLIGTWELKKIEILNIDSLAEKMVEISRKNYDAQIESLQLAIPDQSDTAVINQYEKMIENFEKEKQDVNAKTEKSFLKSNLTTISGIEFIFEKNGTYKESGSETAGTWQLTNKGKNLIIQQNGEQKFTIKKLTNKKLKMIFVDTQNDNELGFHIRFMMVFKKI